MIRVKSNILILIVLFILCAGFCNSGCNSREAQDTLASHPLIAKHYYSGFDLAHDTYNAITPASNGKI